MLSIVLALSVTTALCLCFSSTRLIGVIGLFLLVSLFPIGSSILLVIVGIFYFRYWRK